MLLMGGARWTNSLLNVISGRKFSAWASASKRFFRMKGFSPFLQSGILVGGPLPLGLVCFPAIPGGAWDKTVDGRIFTILKEGLASVVAETSETMAIGFTKAL